jgi:hypothetical protein
MRPPLPSYIYRPTRMLWCKHSSRMRRAMRPGVARPRFGRFDIGAFEAE